MNWLRKVGAFIRGPHFQLGTIVAYGRSLTQVDGVKFAEGQWVYRLCGYPHVSFSETELGEFRDRYMANKFAKANRK